MKSSNWKLGAAGAMALAATTFVSQAHAAAVSVVFAPPTITNPDEAVGVDIVVTGLASAAGGFSLFLDYTNLAFTNYVIGPGGEMGVLPFDLSLGDLGGSVSFSAFADLSAPTDTEAGLFAAQSSGGQFTIARVNFTGVAAGPFTLGLRDVAISDFNGRSLLDCTGAACAGNSIPEPTTALLVAAALGALARTRKQTRSQQEIQQA